MARARNIKPAFFDNEILGELEPLARLLFIGLWCLADREGRLEDRPKRIKKAVLGYDDCDCDKLLTALNDAGFIQRYLVDDVAYIQICTFGKHQKPHQNETASAIPAPYLLPRCEVGTTKETSTRADSLNLDPDCLNTDSLKESCAAKASPRKQFIPPTVLQVADYCQERGNSINAEQFVDYYTANGWLIGKNKMKDWKAAVRTWERNERTFNSPVEKPKKNYVYAGIYDKY